MKAHDVKEKITTIKPIELKKNKEDKGDKK